MTRSTLKTTWARFVESKRGQRILKAARAVFVLGIVAYLAYELRDARWVDIWAGLPTNPLFYLLFLALYFMLPVAEVFVYRITWTFDAWKSFPAFIKKRIYNKDVLGYSGELYFYTWARKNVGLSDLDILKTIRDQNIVSSAASTMVALVLVAIFLYTGQLTVTALIGQPEAAYVVGGAVVLILLTALAVRLRRYLFSMAFKAANFIFIVHFVRLVIGQAMQIAMWAVAMPEVPLRIWFTYAALSIIVTRIPFVPNRDLIFMGFAVSLSGVLGVSEAGLVAMLAALTIVGKVINLVFFSVLSLLNQKTPEVLPPVDLPPARPEPYTMAEPEEVL